MNMHNLHALMSTDNRGRIEGRGAVVKPLLDNHVVLPFAVQRRKLGWIKSSQWATAHFGNVHLFYLFLSDLPS